MKIDKIIFVQTFPTGQFQNQKLGMEVIIEPHDFMDGEIPQIKVAKEAFEFAKKAVAEAFNAMNPHIGEPVTYGSLTDGETVKWDRHEEPLPTKPPPEKDYKAIERLEILIDDSKTIEELAIYKEDASKHGLVEQYMNRLKQLS